MIDALQSADLFVLQLCNQLVAQSQGAFFLALSLSSTIPWIYTACVFAGIWFTRANGSGHFKRGQGEEDFQPNRQRALLLFASMAGAFIIARGIIQPHVFRQRPSALGLVQVPIDPATWHAIKSGLDAQGSFPSDHAVTFTVTVIVAFYINRWFGGFTALAALTFTVMRIAVGFHWPSDMLGGAALAGAVAFGLLKLRPFLESVLNPIILQFRYYPMITYPLAFLVLLDLTQKFSGLFAILSSIIGHPIGH